MRKRTLRTVEDCCDFVRGCTLLGTGGGGDPGKGLELLVPEIEAGKELRWVDIESLPDTRWTASCWGMGSIAPQLPSKEGQKAILGLREEQKRYNLHRAVLELASYSDVTVEAIVPAELGGRNTPGPMWAALKLGLPVVDGD